MRRGPQVRCLLLPLALVLGVVAARPAISSEYGRGEIDKDDDSKTFSIAAAGGLTSEGYGIAGTGGSLSLPRSWGSLLETELKYRPSASDYSLRMIYRQTQTQFAGLTGITPSTLELTRRNIGVSIFLHPFSGSSHGGLDSLQIGLGYYFLLRSATATTPTAIVNSASQSGILLSALYALKFSKFRTEGALDVALPHRFSEEGKKTGYFSSALNIEVSAKIVYPLNDWLDVAGGLLLHSNSVNYVGTGERGLPDATEGQLGYGIPLELRVRF